MDSYTHLPNDEITAKGEISSYFSEKKIATFKEACLYVHNIPYGYNADKDNKWSLFQENKGSCTTKHGVIATLAEELDIPVLNHVGIYAFNEEICTGAQKILDTYQIPYIPMVHCFLQFGDYRFDLTEGNQNGKNKPIDEMLFDQEVVPFITRKDEYLLYKNVLEQKIMTRPEMQGISIKIILKAREKAIALLHQKIAHNS